MPVEDNNAERRNLIVTSLCFIVFFLGEGSFVDNTVTLQVVNVSFCNTKVLAVIAWLMLFWFALRYWQINHGKFITSFKQDIDIRRHSYFVIMYAELKLKMKHRKQGGFLIKSLKLNGSECTITYGTIPETSGSVNEKGILVNFSSINNKTLAITGLFKLPILIVISLHLAVTRVSFGNHVLPYILFLLSVFLGLKNAVL